MYGNRNQSQYYQNQQGVAEFKNDALIENAITAVRTIVPIPSDDGGVYEPSGTGGIIIAANTTFRNNQRAILFLPYENFIPGNHHIANNFSVFSECTFETTDRLADTTVYPENFVELNGVRGIPFTGCTFRNITPATSKIQRGNGIYAIHSSFYVREKCLDIYNPCINELPSKFIKLDYGIKSLAVDPEKPAFIYKSVFDRNSTGIYLGSVQYATVIMDTFIVISPNPNSYDTIVGLYLDKCHAYTIEENRFSSNYDSSGLGGSNKNVGIAVNNTNLVDYLEVDNRIYNNWFYKLNFSILAMNKNRNNNGSRGLSLRCNDFIEPNEYDISVTKEIGSSLMGIKNPQGNNGTLSTDPAGNTFSYTGKHPYSDFFNDGDDINYWYHYLNNGAHVEPLFHSPAPIVNPQTNQNNYHSYIKNESCPSSFSSGGGGGIDDFIAEKYESEINIDSISGLLSLLVDGGNTPGTNTTILTSTSNETMEVRNDLLSKTPYLSDTVMINAAAKEDVLTPAIITEILSANPQAAKSDAVMETLENRIVPLSDEQLAEVEQGLIIIGAKESLETKLAEHLLDYNTALYKIIAYYKNDSLNPLAGDSVIWYLNVENQLWAKYSLVFEYLCKGDTLNGENILDNITSSFVLDESELNEHQQYLDYFNLWKQMRRINNSITNADSIQMQTLLEIMNNSNGSISTYARNILLTNGMVDYKEPYIFPEESLKSSNIKYRTSNQGYEKNVLKVYPNPARDYIIVEFTLNMFPENTKVELYDVTGKNLKTVYLEDTHDWLVIPVQDLPGGSYLCCLKIENKSINCVKFILAK